MSERVNFVHLTDLHVGNPQVQDDDLYSETSATLSATLAQIKALVPPPEFIVVSGDLTNRGDAGSYEELKRLMAQAELDVPVLFALGNHDRRDGFYPVMLGRHENLDEPYDHAEVIAGIHIIVMDTSVPGKVGGAFEPGQIEWLEDELENHPELPKLLVMHHAPALDFDRPDAGGNPSPLTIPRFWTSCCSSMMSSVFWRATSITTASRTGRAFPSWSASASISPLTRYGCMRACAWCPARLSPLAR